MTRSRSSSRRNGTCRLSYVLCVVVDVGVFLCYPLAIIHLTNRSPFFRYSNTGLAGGKFLERCKTTNAPAGRTFLPSDFFVGARIEVFRRQFEILEADEYALNYMEQHCDEFPMSDGKRVTAYVCLSVCLLVFLSVLTAVFWCE